MDLNTHPTCQASNCSARRAGSKQSEPDSMVPDLRFLYKLLQLLSGTRVVPQGFLPWSGDALDKQLTCLTTQHLVIQLRNIICWQRSCWQASQKILMISQKGLRITRLWLHKPPEAKQIVHRLPTNFHIWFAWHRNDSSTRIALWRCALGKQELFWKLCFVVLIKLLSVFFIAVGSVKDWRGCLRRKLGFRPKKPGEWERLRGRIHIASPRTKQNATRVDELEYAHVCQWYRCWNSSRQ